MEDFEKRIIETINGIDVASILQRLIKAPSCYPPGNTVRVADVCETILRENGIPSKRVALDETLPSVIGELGSAEGPVVVMHSHIDTVPTGEEKRWTYPPFSGTIANGMVYGRGAGDCKGSTAVQLAAMIALKKAGVNLSGKVQIACVADEENCGKKGTKWLREEKILNPDFLIIGEQTEDKVAVAERQAIWVKLIVDGKASHAAIPWRGENAIVRMAYVIKELEEYLKPRLRSDHPYLPPSTMSINLIEGGTKENVVPESCAISIDRRVLPGESKESVFHELEEVLDRVKSKIGPFPSRLELIIDQGPSIDTDPDCELVKIMQKALKDITGREEKIISYAQGSDARYFSQDGIPVVIFGPSDPDVGHMVDECCSIAQLEDGARVLALTVVRLLGV